MGKDKQSAGDLVHAGIRAILSAIPDLGGPAAVLFESIFKKPNDRRRDAVLTLVERAIAELQQRPDVDFDALRNRDDFCEFAYDVLRAASRTHRQEKLEAFRHAMINAALPNAPEQTKSRVFLRLIDELDVHHLLLLDLLANPGAFLAKRGEPFPGPADDPLIERDALTQDQSPRSLLSIVTNVLRDELPMVFLELALQDLKRRGLVDGGTALSSMCVVGKSLASALGQEFVRFIDDPPEPASG